MQRSKPNILITGTPGTGKTTTCQQVVEAIGFTYINIGDWVKEQELHSGWDDEHDCYIIDEDKVRIVSRHLVNGRADIHYFALHFLFHSRTKHPVVPAGVRRP